MALTNKQELFVEEYLRTFNATQAAIKAGYSPKSAHATGWETLRKPEVEMAISQRLKATAMGADEVMMRLARQARGSMESFVEIVGDKASINWRQVKDAGALDLVKKITETTRTFKDETTITLSVELYDAQSALQLIGKHHRLFVDRAEITGEDGGPIPIIAIQPGLLQKLTDG